MSLFKTTLAVCLLQTALAQSNWGDYYDDGYYDEDEPIEEEEFEDDGGDADMIDEELLTV